MHNFKRKVVLSTYTIIADIVLVASRGEHFLISNIQVSRHTAAIDVII